MKRARSQAEKDASFMEDDAQNAAPRKASPTRRKRWPRFIYWMVVLGVWGSVVLGLTFVWVAWDLPDADQAIQAERKPAVRIVTQQGIEIARRGDLYGAPVLLKDLPPALPHAILATEDRRFYDHFGLDLIGIARAMVANVQAGGIVQGGSTITQQAAKNLFLAPERTLRRKLQEVLLALWLEAKFTKDQIFTIYLNRVYFGQGAYGVDAAARYYFSIPATRLNVYQSAVLAGMLKGPNRYNPFINPKLSRRRTEVVLGNMVAAGYLSAADMQAIVRPKVWWKSKISHAAPIAQHLADWVFEQVGDYVALNQDMNVIVTIDSAMQAKAEAAVKTMMKPGGVAQQRGAAEIALVALAPDGAVRALVGGASYSPGAFNRAVQAKRQPGSAFKPIVYLAGFEAGLTPNSTMVDEPLTVEKWSPKNFKNEYLGQMTLKEAMARSINTIAVKVSERAGRANVQAMAKRLGITAELTGSPSLALGSSEVSVLELCAAYGVFATGGLGVWPYAISEIQDTTGKPIYVRTGGGPGRVIEAGYSGAMNAMLAEVIDSEFGTGSVARLARPAAGKTGTSQDYRDAWFVGYTADLIAAVWMGNDDGKPMKNVTGGTLPAMVWKDFMSAATAGMPVRALPDGTVPGDANESVIEDAPNATESFFKKMIDSLFGN
ncbi:MAG: PBP1A family penicillin-binding protein [Rhodospirillales bacterium]|nr:PBP1A family penicillin-binding protein [Rhodospirillales bacterium]